MKGSRVVAVVINEINTFPMQCKTWVVNRFNIGNKSIFKMKPWYLVVIIIIIIVVIFDTNRNKIFFKFFVYLLA